jgi:hypothetical protein
LHARRRRRRRIITTPNCAINQNRISQRHSRNNRNDRNETIEVKQRKKEKPERKKETKWEYRVTNKRDHSNDKKHRVMLLPWVVVPIIRIDSHASYSASSVPSGGM